ncbi:MAG TPA: PQQ-binding-like beta-propeller repeat protein [Pirellulaceae bacterium]|jgi:outer membrane protein assembly factor BamB
MIIRLSIAVVCFSLSIAAPASAQNWPQFRGPNTDGIASDAVHPEKWSPEENLAWKTPIPGIGWSQPVVWGDKIFLTTAVSENAKRPKPGDWSPGDAGMLTAIFGNYRKPPATKYQWLVLCLDRANGKILWQQTAHEGNPPIPIHAQNTYATETPATDGERLIAYFGMVGAYCYDLDGKLLWLKDLGNYPTQMDWGTGSSPIIHGDLVFIQCDNDKSSFLIALNKKTGDEVWRVTRDERSNWCTPLIWKNDSRTELIVGGGTKMRSYDPTTGKLLWEMAASGRSATSPVATSKLLFVDSGDRLTGQRGILAAIKPGGTGDISLAGSDATSDFVAWSVNFNGHPVASPIVVNDCLFLLTQSTYVVTCFDANTGKQHYRQRLPGAAGLTASPWAIGGKIFCLDQSGQTFILAAEPNYKLLGTNKLADEMFWASPAPSGDSLFLRGLDHLYCIR